MPSITDIMIQETLASNASEIFNAFLSRQPRREIKSNRYAEAVFYYEFMRNFLPDLYLLEERLITTVNRYFDGFAVKNK